MDPLTFLGWALVAYLGAGIACDLRAAWLRRRARKHRRSLRDAAERDWS